MKLLAYHILVAASIVFNSCSNAQMTTSKKVLIVYLTRTNNTKSVAEMIQSKMGGDLLQIEPKNPYPKDYQKHVEQVDDENEREYLPPLKNEIKISGYDIIFIGFPTWDMQVPPPMKTFLKENNWTGKTIVPFNTNSCFGLGSSQSQFAQYCSKGSLKEIFSVTGGYEKKGIMYVMQGNKAIEVSKQLDNWLNKIGLLKKTKN
jgi:flavodoxin